MIHTFTCYHHNTPVLVKFQELVLLVIIAFGKVALFVISISFIRVNKLYLIFNSVQADGLYWKAAVRSVVAAVDEAKLSKNMKQTKERLVIQ